MRSTLFSVLASLAFVATFISINYIFFYPRFGDVNQSLYPILTFIAIWGMPSTIFFSFVAWRIGVAAEQKRNHEEMMEGLKAIYRVMQSARNDK